MLRRAGWDVDANGLFGAPPIQVFIGDDAHTSVFSALQFLGLGHDRVDRVATDAQGRMLPAAFAHAIAGTNGRPSSSRRPASSIQARSTDPRRSCAAAREHGAWVHVDGAFGLWARACAATAHLASGVELAKSWATDGHKWLQTPYDCGYAIVRDAEAHRRAMTIAASYLPPVAMATAIRPISSRSCRVARVVSRPGPCSSILGGKASLIWSSVTALWHRGLPSGSQRSPASEW